ncbi:Uncharacterized protein Adt_10681 [Abeliophyllum distichum]|uniref:Uncharacterized protein n=1 Tax=Abeliophyllum distichum TaxID=126358 RepID=A0ABD1UKP6_9LAMI
MIFFPVVNEACRVLDEGIVVKVADLDISAVMGMGFSLYKGGILFWANSLGSKYICSRLESGRICMEDSLSAVLIWRRIEYGADEDGIYDVGIGVSVPVLRFLPCFAATILFSFFHCLSDSGLAKRVCSILQVVDPIRANYWKWRKSEVTVEGPNGKELAG